MDDFEKYYIKAAHFLKYRPRSVKEVRDKLKEKKASPEIIERIIATLTEQKFLNDREFARLWVRQRIFLKPKSKRIIALELRQKGIDKEVIEEVLLDPGEDQEVNDLSQAKKLVSSKIHKYKGFQRQEVYQKLGGFLARRGFSWDTIRQSIDEALE